MTGSRSTSAESQAQRSGWFQVRRRGRHHAAIPELHRTQPGLPSRKLHRKQSSNYHWNCHSDGPTDDESARLPAIQSQPSVLATAIFLCADKIHYVR